MAGLGCRRVGAILPKLYGLQFERQCSLSLFRTLGRNTSYTSSRNLALSSVTRIQSELKIKRDDIVTNSGFDSHVDRRVSDLNEDLRRTGRVQTNMLKETLETMDWSQCTSSHALTLLKCFGKPLSDETKADRMKMLNHYSPIIRSNVSFDVSHYNTILKVHLENETPVDITTFLTKMEADNVELNRITYQHIIGLYCMDGNIDAATTVLEHIKTQDMAINQSVLHALLMGHTINGDRQAVNEVFEVMESSSLPIGADTYTVLLKASAKAGNWEQVEEWLTETKKKQINLDAGDYFELFCALCENNMEDKVKQLRSTVPKQLGYLQEVRTALPQLMFTGCTDLAMDVFNTDYFEVLCRLHGGTHHGAFVGASLAKSSATPEKCAKIIGELAEKGQFGPVYEFLAVCIDQDKKEHLSQATSQLKQIKDLQLHGINLLWKFVLHSRKVGACLSYMHEELGLRLNYNVISNNLLAKLTPIGQARGETPLSIVQQIKRDVGQLPSYLLYKNMVRELLKRETLAHTKECVGFILSTQVRVLDPRDWCNNLARTVVKEDCVDELVTILTVAKISIQNNHQDADAELRLNYLFEVLKLLKDPAQIRRVVADLNEIQLGVPTAIAKQLNAMHSDPELEALLTIAVADSERTLTNDGQQKLISNRQRLHGVYSLPGRARLMRGDYGIPDDPKHMMMINERLEQMELLNPRLTSKLVSSLAEMGKLEEALSTLRKAGQTDPTFTLTAFALQNVVGSYLRNDDASGALDFFNEFCRDAKPYFSTLIQIIEHFAKQGNHERVLDTIKMIPKLEMYNTRSSWCQSILKVYQSAGDMNKLEETLNALCDAIPTRACVRELSPCLVDFHVERDELPAAVDKFVELAQRHSFLPPKLDLMTRLVREENVELLQKITDVCIGVKNEETTLYDLTLVFLLEGHTSKAQRMLDTPGLSYDQNQIKFLIRHFKKKGRLDCVRQLVQMSRNLFGCDRDFMYTELIHLQDADTLDQTVVQMQEENHVPSPQLADLIHRKRHGIPGNNTPASPENEQEASEKTTGKKRQRSKKTKPATPVDTTSETTPTTVDSAAASAPMAAAMAAGDVSLVVQLARDNSSSTDEEKDDMKTGLLYLINQEKFSEALAVLEEVKYHPKLRPILSKLLKRMLANADKDVEAAAYDFFARRSEELAPVIDFRFLQRMRFVDAPEKLFTAVEQEGSDSQQFLLGPVHIKKIFRKCPDMKSRLEGLASKGNRDASLILARHCCDEQDSEGMQRHWSVVSEANRPVRDYIVNINSLDRLRWINSILPDNADVLRESVAQCLTNTATAASKEQTPTHTPLLNQIVDYACAEQGLSLQELCQWDFQRRGGAEVKHYLDQYVKKKESSSSQ